MKILIDARMYGLEHTGIGRYLIGLITELKSIQSKNEYVILLKKKYYDSLSFPGNWKKVLADIPHYSLREQLALPKVINRENPDLVHFPHLNVPILYRGKYVLTVHDLIMQRQGIDATKLPLLLYFLKRIPFMFISKTAVKNAVKIIVPSKAVATDIANYYDVSVRKIEVTYEGFYFKDLSDLSTHGEMAVLSRYGLLEKKYFFYIGNAYPHKNLKIAVRAVMDLNVNKNIDAILVIAGLKDCFLNKLENYINDIGAGKYVKLTGYVKDEELPVLYKNSIGFVYPSLAEGFGLQGIEAISMGTMVACSNIPVFKEIYGFHAFYFNPKDVSSISGVLYSLDTISREDKNKYIRNAMDYVKRYSWNKMAKETLDVYENVK